jgi:hypothetical protein
VERTLSSRREPMPACSQHSPCMHEYTRTEHLTISQHQLGILVRCHAVDCGVSRTPHQLNSFEMKPHLMPPTSHHTLDASSSKYISNLVHPRLLFASISSYSSHHARTKPSTTRVSTSTSESVGAQHLNQSQPKEFPIWTTLLKSCLQSRLV